MVAQHSEVTEIFADHYAKTLKDPHMKSNQNKFIRRKKQDTGIPHNWNNPKWHTKFLIGTLKKVQIKAFHQDICTFGIFGPNMIFSSNVKQYIYFIGKVSNI